MSNQIQTITPTQLIQSPAMQKKLQEVLGEKKMNISVYRSSNQIIEEV